MSETIADIHGLAKKMSRAYAREIEELITNQLKQFGYNPERVIKYPFFLNRIGTLKTTVFAVKTTVEIVKFSELSLWLRVFAVIFRLRLDSCR